MVKNLKKIDFKKAHGIINENRPLENYYVSGRLDLGGESKIFYPLIIRNCFLEDFSCPSVEFLSEVQLINTTFSNATFAYSYFVQGLIMENCLFHNYLDFQAGGHNLKPIRIVHCIFDDFVNFFDCWFQAGVVIKNNTFKKGTNIIGNKGEYFEVKFGNKPIVQDNTGAVDLNGEGV